MALNIESCSVKEVCDSVGGTETLLIELTDKLQDWLKLQPHLPQNVPKEVLEYFILGTKMSLEQAKHKLDMFYTMRRLVPELLTDRDPHGAGLVRMQKIADTVYLPKLTPEKYRVYILRPFAFNDYNKFDAMDAFKYALMIEEILMTESHSLGSIYVFDHAVVNLSFILRYTPTVIKKSEVAITEAFAKRIKGIHIVNAASVAETAISMTKKALKPKLAARIHAHPKGSFESFYQHIPKSILPKDYGGDEPSMTDLAELWRQKVDAKRDWFLEQDKIQVNEALRPKSAAIDSDSLFGFSGSFRKLDLD